MSVNWLSGSAFGRRSEAVRNASDHLSGQARGTLRVAGGFGRLLGLEGCAGSWAGDCRSARQIEIGVGRMGCARRDLHVAGRRALSLSFQPSMGCARRDLGRPPITPDMFVRREASGERGAAGSLPADKISADPDPADLPPDSFCALWGAFSAGPVHRPPRCRAARSSRPGPFRDCSGGGGVTKGTCRPRQRRRRGFE